MWTDCIDASEFEIRYKNKKSMMASMVVMKSQSAVMKFTEDFFLEEF